VAKGARPNRVETNGVTRPRRLVEGNQEDIDLVIASGLDLILIEAKAVGAWDNQQLASKLLRLSLVYSEYHSSVTKAAEAPNPVRFHFLLMSPYYPRKLKVEWPEWARTQPKVPAWIHLPLPSETLEVSRRDDKGKRTRQSKKYWCVIESKSNSRPARLGVD
jgi:hypothetical protein